MSSGKTGEFRKNVLLVVGALAFSLIAAEIIVRIVDPVRPPDRVEFMVDSETYWRVIPNQHDPRPPAVSVNSQGFRGRADIGPKRDGVTRVFVLGDSYAWGWGVADEETFSAQLEVLANGRLEVINGGTPGWGVFQFQARLERWVDRLSPDVVVVFVNTADILRQPYPTQEEEDAFLRDSALRNTVRRVSKLVTVTYRLYDRMRLQMQNRQVGNAVAIPAQDSVRLDAYQELLRRDTVRLAEMAQLARRRDARFVLVAWPQQRPTTPSFLESMRTFSEVQDVPLVDLTETLARNRFEDYALPNDHHPSAFGHKLIAEQLLPVIAGEGAPR